MNTRDQQGLSLDLDVNQTCGSTIHTIHLNQVSLMSDLSEEVLMRLTYITLCLLGLTWTIWGCDDSKSSSTGSTSGGDPNTMMDQGALEAEVGHAHQTEF